MHTDAYRLKGHEWASSQWYQQSVPSEVAEVSRGRRDGQQGGGTARWRGNDPVPLKAAYETPLISPAIHIAELPNDKIGSF